jgi:hypothetical protein
MNSTEYQPLNNPNNTGRPDTLAPTLNSHA